MTMNMKNKLIFEFASYSKLDNRTMNKIMFDNKSVSSVLLKSYELFCEEKALDEKIYELEQKYSLCKKDDINKIINEDIDLFYILNLLKINAFQFAEMYNLPVNTVQNWKNKISKAGVFLLNTIYRIETKNKMLDLLNNIDEVYKCQN